MLQRLRDARTRGHDASPRGAPPSAPMSARLSTADWTGLPAAIAGDVVLPGSTPLRARAPARHGPLLAGAAAGDRALRDAGRRRRDARLRSPLRDAGRDPQRRRTASPAAPRPTGIVIDVAPMNAVSAAEGTVATVGAGARLARRLRRAGRARARPSPAAADPTVGIAGLTLGGGLGHPRPPARADLRPAASPPQVVLADGRGRRLRRATTTPSCSGRCAAPAAAGSASVTRSDVRHGAGAGARPASSLHLAARRRRRDDRGVAGLGARRARRAGRQPAGHRRPRTRPGWWPSGCSAPCSVPKPTRRAARCVRRARRAAARPRPPSPSCRTGETKRHLAELDAGSALKPEPAHLLVQVRVLPALPAGGRDRCPRRPSGQPAASRDAHASSTSSPGAAPTTGWTPTPRRSCIVPSGSCSSTRSPSRLRRRSRGHASGWRVDGRWCTRPAPAAAYPNFPDPELSPWDPAYHGANGDRLRRMKASYDPDGVFGANDRR